MPRLFTTVVRRIVEQVVGPSARFAEGAEVNDTGGAIVGVPSAVEAADAIGTTTATLADDVQVADEWRTTTRAEWAEDAQVDDLFGMTTRLDDDLTAEDVIGLARLRTPEPVTVDDLLGARVKLSEDANADDFARVTFTNVSFGPSATPDNDASGDSWIQQNGANTNNGTATTMSIKGQTPVLNDERRGLLFFDFTRYANLTVAAGGTHTFRFRAQHNVAAGANNLLVEMSTLAAKPFVESTVTWNNQPAAGTVRVNPNVSIAAGGIATYTVTLTDQNVTDFLGNWVLVRMISNAALDTTIFTIQARETANVSDRPTLAFRLKR